MRCNAFCLGNSLDCDRLKNSLTRREDETEFTAYDGCIAQHFKDPHTHVFYFDQGTVITWNLTRKEADEIVKKCMKFISEPTDEIQHDDFSFRYAKETAFEPHGFFNVDIISLSSEDPLLKMAISFALSQSVKLQLFDHIIQHIFDEHAHLLEKMRKTGKTKLKARRLTKIMAHVFTIKNRINLDSELFTLPSFFWKQSSYEKDHLMTHSFLDIEERAAALNQKVDVLSDMFELLKSQIEHRHFFTLEVIIVILIFVEILESIPKIF